MIHPKHADSVTHQLSTVNYSTVNYVTRYEKIDHSQKIFEIGVFGTIDEEYDEEVNYLRMKLQRVMA